MDEEIKSMIVNKTWSLVPKPENAKAIECKWIYKLKEGNSELDPPKFKARLVAKGFRQREGIDYNEIFAPVVKYKTLRFLLALTAVYNWELHQMDVKTTFLHVDLNETIYMTQPKGYIDRNLPNHCCLLNRSIYGLKQSPRQWNKKFNYCMMSLGFARSNYDTCLYLRRLKHETVSYVLLYVDDILIISNSKPEITGIKTDLSKHFDMKDMGFAQKILDIKLFRDRISRKMFLSQVDYVNKVLDKFSMKHAKSTSIPLGGHLIFSKDDCPKTELEKQEMHDIPYDVVVGSVMYAMLCTRPDLGFVMDHNCTHHKYS
ncbi:unnamed protein product [Rhodiola kirilowii]